MGKKSKKTWRRTILLTISRSRHVILTLFALVCLYVCIYYIGITDIARTLTNDRYISDVTERYGILRKKNSSGIYVMNAEGICGSDPNAVELLVAVITATRYFERRDAIRRTWGTIVKTNPRVKVVFFLGVSTGYDEGKLWLEGRDNQDMVQLNYTDKYEDLTFKSISILKWVADYCYHASYVLKTDDDALVNVENMMTSLNNAKKSHSAFIMCYVWKGAPVIRMKKHKYYVPYEAYKPKTYPNYCGGLYAFTAGLSKSLYRTCLKTPFIPMEDVYVTGMVASQLKIPLVHDSGFVLDQYRIKRRHRKIDPCIYRNISIYVEYSPKELQTIWEKYDPNTCG